MNSLQKIPLTVFLAGAYLVVVIMFEVFSDAAFWLIVLYLILSGLTYLAYAIDKRAAQQGRWRIQENTLHLLALSGGWPGALVAQHHLRHKSQKQPFKTILWMTIVIHCSAVAWMVELMPSGFL